MAIESTVEKFFIVVREQGGRTRMIECEDVEKAKGIFIELMRSDDVQFKRAFEVNSFGRVSHYKFYVDENFKVQSKMEAEF